MCEALTWNADRSTPFFTRLRVEPFGAYRAGNHPHEARAERARISPEFASALPCKWFRRRSKICRVLVARLTMRAVPRRIGGFRISSVHRTVPDAGIETLAPVGTSSFTAPCGPTIGAGSPGFIRTIDVPLKRERRNRGWGGGGGGVGHGGRGGGA